MLLHRQWKAFIFNALGSDVDLWFWRQSWVHPRRHSGTERATQARCHSCIECFRRSRLDSKNTCMYDNEVVPRQRTDVTKPLTLSRDAPDITHEQQSFAGSLLTYWVVLIVSVCRSYTQHNIRMKQSRRHCHAWHHSQTTVVPWFGGQRHSYVLIQWLGRQSLAGGLSLIYAWSMVDMWPLCG